MKKLKDSQTFFFDPSLIDWIDYYMSIFFLNILNNDLKKLISIHIIN